MLTSPARRLPLAAVLVIIAGLFLLAPSALARPASSTSSTATTTAKKVKACKKRKGETRKHWLKRCKCKTFKRGEARKQFKKRCPGAKVPKRKPTTGGGQTPGGTTTPPPPPPAPIIEPVRNDAGFAEVLGRSDFLRTYEPGSGATHSESYKFCSARLVHEYEGIAYIYRSNGPWRVVEGFINGDGTKGRGTIEYTQEVANFDEERGKVQVIKYTWPAPGTISSDFALIEHPEIGSYHFSRSVRSTTC